MDNTAYLAGVVVGVVIAIVLVSLIMKYIHKDNSKKAKYDERQKIIRGEGYKYGFYAMLFCEAILLFAGSSIDKYIEYSVLYFIVICISLLVFVGYCIFKESYFALNEQPKKVMVVILIVTVLNIISGIGQVYNGYFIEKGKIRVGAMNFIAAIFLIIIFILLLIKHIMKKNEEGKE